MDKPVKHLFQGSTSLLAAALLYSFYGALSRVVGLEFGKVFQITARFSILVIFFFFYVTLTKQWKKIAKADIKWIILMSLPGLVGTIFTFIVFNHLSLGTACFILYASSTLSSYLIGYILFKEKLTKIKIYSLITCLLGLYLIFADTMSLGKTFYLILMMIGGLGAASWNIVSKKLSSKYPIGQILFIDGLIYIIISLPIAFWLQEPISTPSLNLPWMGIVLFSLVTIVASFLTVNGYKYLQAQIGSLIMLTEPFFAAIVGWLLYKEMLNLVTFAGGLLIILGSSLPAIHKLKTNKG